MSNASETVEYADSELNRLPDAIREALRGIEVRSRFDITPGTVIPGNMLAANELVFHPGGDVTIGSPGDVFALIYADRIVFQDGTIPSVVTIPTASPNSGAAGPEGRPAARGGNGADADEPRLQRPFALIAGSIEFVRAPAAGVSPLRIVSRGANGGAGGPGGSGGNGTPGAKGHDGSSEREPR